MIKYVLVRELAYYNKKTVSNIRPQMSFDLRCPIFDVKFDVT